MTFREILIAAFKFWWDGMARVGAGLGGFWHEPENWDDWNKRNTPQDRLVTAYGVPGCWARM